MSFFEDVPDFSPVQFFEMSADCAYLKGEIQPKKAYLLPSTEDLLGEEIFSDVYVGWSLDKLSFLIDVKAPFQKIVEGDFEKGDSVELFIDTRDLKARSSVSRYCHHFVFFPQQVGPFYGKEITRFRGDDVHTLCHPEDLLVSSTISPKGYRIVIDLPSACLHGYDPLSFSRLGFTYRINRYEQSAQHFAVSSKDYVIEQHPAMWGTLKLLEQR